MGVDRRIITPEGYALDFEWDGDVVTRAFWEPRSLATKQHNVELRKHDVPKDTALGRPALSMDEVDRYTIAKLFPGINSADAKERSKEWRRFIASPLSAPYRVIDNVS